MQENLDSKFDNVFRELKKTNGLTWLPWVGKNFDNSKIRLLIVGESHYDNNSDPEDAKRGIETCMNSENYTREVIYENPICHDWPNPTFDNLHRTFFESKQFNRAKLWQELAFYNFIQRCLEYRVIERPSPEDFYEGWATFVSVIKILKPDMCLFIGVEAANSFNQAMQEIKIDHEDIKWDKQISRTYSRLGSITMDNIKTRMIFIQHASKMFSWSQWHQYLKDNIPEQIEYLTSLCIGV